MGFGRLCRPLGEIQHVAAVTMCLKGTEEESRPKMRSEEAKESKAARKELDSYMGEGSSSSNSPSIPKNVECPEKQPESRLNRAPVLLILVIKVETAAEPMECYEDWDSGTATLPPALTPGVPSLSNVDEESQLPRQSRNRSR
ncbi:hypothetical protein TSAR_013762 [Trichomalopsis sarcophagae]|uniref:Uncharacterized protein n=1 Tax=Trichomalopsis sarcophagae TaxID=543379 RepID=A0A232FMP2_9HYME|nr:hypothetical protein TSAR_013762 [Trichomalopsis sarcophagae]